MTETGKKVKLLQTTMIRWAEDNKDQRIVVDGQREIKNKWSSKTWQKDFAEVLRLCGDEPATLSKKKKRVLNNLWNIYK